MVEHSDVVIDGLGVAAIFGSLGVECGEIAGYDILQLLGCVHAVFHLLGVVLYDLRELLHLLFLGYGTLYRLVLHTGQVARSHGCQYRCL